MGSIANSIANKAHLKAFDDLFKQRFENFDLSAVTMYIIETAPAEALYYLAEQFDVLGYKGWVLCDNDQEKRALIKKAIELHRYKGTVYAIEEAIKAVGFSSVQVIEHVGVQFDGEFDHDNTITFTGGNWATFSVKIGLPNDVEVDAQTLTNVVEFINEYKNARSHLLNIIFQISFTDTIAFNEFIDLGEGVEDNIFSGLYFDGAANFDGSNNFNKGVEVCTLTITNSQTGEIITDEF